MQNPFLTPLNTKAVSPSSGDEALAMFLSHPQNQDPFLVMSIHAPPPIVAAFLSQSAGLTLRLEQAENVVLAD